MSAYIIRRLLYAIPILIGVNIFTFILFFFVNTPDDMARAHLGTKRVTAEQMAKWKRERDYHLPYFYNQGWRQIGVRQVSGEATSLEIMSQRAGHYRIRIIAPQPDIGDLALQLQATGGASVEAADTALVLDLEEPVYEQEFEVQLDGAADPSHTLKIAMEPSQDAPQAVAYLEIKEDIGLLSHFTETIFWKKSVRYLFFQFGRADDGRRIGAEILQRIGPSLSITVPIFIIGILVNITVAMGLAFFRGTYLDFWGVVLAVVMMSVSVLFCVIGGQWLLGKTLRMVPISGFDTGVHALKFVALPVIIGVAGGIGSGVRLYRTFFLEEIGKDYVRTARAKGLPESIVLFQHALKNALIPILTGVVVSIPFLITGSLILESFFAIPGMGSFTLEAIQRQDFAIVQAMVFLGSVVYIVGLLMTDISYTLVDPRIRFS
jgi:peptide/nickel transport system permease protein